MTITQFQMYLITSLDAFMTAFIMFGIVGAFVVAMIGCEYRRVFWFMPIPLISIVLGVLTPSTKQMAAILIVPAIVNNEEVQKLPNSILGLADEWLEELRPGKDGEGK